VKKFSGESFTAWTWKNELVQSSDRIIYIDVKTVRPLSCENTVTQYYKLVY